MLESMAKRRVIEDVKVDLADRKMSIESTDGGGQLDPLKLPTPPSSPNRKKFEEDDDDVHYRFVDPWEVESWLSDETISPIGAIGRSIYSAVKVGNEGLFDEIIRDIGGMSYLSLWQTHRGERHLINCISNVKKCAKNHWQYKNSYLTELKYNLERNLIFDRMGTDLR